MDPTTANIDPGFPILSFLTKYHQLLKFQPKPEQDKQTAQKCKALRHANHPLTFATSKSAPTNPQHKKMCIFGFKILKGKYK